MRDILSKFPKDVLINYMIERCWLRSTTRLEADLLWMWWDMESRAAVNDMLKYSDEASAHLSNGDIDRCQQANAEWEKAQAR